MPDVMVWVTKPGDEGVQDLETLGEEVRGLEHVSEVDVRVEGSVVHVSFEGGKAEQEEIEDAIRQAGYEILRFRIEKVSLGEPERSKGFWMDRSRDKRVRC